jgi:hypothetical protein
MCEVFECDFLSLFHQKCYICDYFELGPPLSVLGICYGTASLALVSRVYKSCDMQLACRAEPQKFKVPEDMVKGEKFEPAAYTQQQPPQAAHQHPPVCTSVVKRTNWRFNHIWLEIMQPARSRF